MYTSPGNKSWSGSSTLWLAQVFSLGGGGCIVRIRLQIVNWPYLHQIEPNLKLLNFSSPVKTCRFATRLRAYNFDRVRPIFFIALRFFNWNTRITVSTLWNPMLYRASDRTTKVSAVNCPISNHLFGSKKTTFIPKLWAKFHGMCGDLHISIPPKHSVLSSISIPSLEKDKKHTLLRS